jgi:long-subunit acyl-CoA synthetase (AMP-forming)
MEGYYNDPEATMRAMGDGWFHTGDAAGVTFSGELPKTATGKIQKYVLRKGAPNLSRQ